MFSDEYNYNYFLTILFAIIGLTPVILKIYCPPFNQTGLHYYDYCIAASLLLQIPFLYLLWDSKGKVNVMKRNILRFTLIYLFIVFAISFFNPYLWKNKILDILFPWIMIIMLIIYLFIGTIIAYSRKGYFVILHFPFYPISFLSMKSSKSIGKKEPDKIKLKENIKKDLDSVLMELNEGNQYALDTHPQICDYLLCLDDIHAISIIESIRCENIENRDKVRLKKTKKFKRMFKNLYGNEYTGEIPFIEFEIRFKVLRKITKNDIQYMVRNYENYSLNKNKGCFNSINS